MKKIILFLILAVTSNVNAQDIILTNTNTQKKIYGVAFVNDTEGYALYNNGIIRTTDGGNNWNDFYMDSMSDHNYSSLIVANDSLFCFGQDINGASIKISSSFGNPQFSISILNKPVIGVLFYNGKIYCNSIDILEDTTFNNILNMPEGPFNIMNGKISLATNAMIYYSDIDNINWVQDTFTDMTLTSGPYQSFTIGNDTLMAITHYPGILHYSVDGGESWSIRDIPDVSGYLYQAGKLWVCGGFINKKIIYYSDNLGESFDSIIVDKGVNSLYFLNDNIAFAYGDSGVIYKITNINPVSISSPSLKKKIRIYPNPASDKVNIEYEQDLKLQSVQLMDIRGRLLKTFSINKKELNIEGIAAGSYFLQIVTDQGTHTEKIIIK